LKLWLHTGSDYNILPSPFPRDKAIFDNYTKTKDGPSINGISNISKSLCPNVYFCESWRIDLLHKSLPRYLNHMCERRSLKYKEVYWFGVDILYWGFVHHYCKSTWPVSKLIQMFHKSENYFFLTQQLVNEYLTLQLTCEIMTFCVKTFYK